MRRGSCRLSVRARRRLSGRTGPQPAVISATRPDERSGTAFFAGDEESTLPRWTLIVAWIDGLPRRGASATKIISAATATFDVFARWAAVARTGVPWSI